jgi:hypothetical protein
MEKPLFLRSNYLYVFGLIVLATGLPVSLFLISISQFILAGSFFLEGNVTEKFKRFLNNKAAVLIAGYLADASHRSVLDNKPCTRLE